MLFFKTGMHGFKRAGGRVKDFIRFYDRAILVKLKKMQGCRCANMIESVDFQMLNC